MNTSVETGMSRGQFIRMAIGVPVGIAAGIATAEVAPIINHEVTSVTNHPTGNAGEAQMAQQACADVPDKEKCANDYEPPFGYKLDAVVRAPLVEETMFRVFPSFLLDESSSDDQDAVETLIHGTDRKSFTRGELVVGGISSLIFGALHNLTSKGYDTKTIPSSETVDGFILWGLQRKFGTLSNVTMHAVHNFLAVKT